MLGYIHTYAVEECGKALFLKNLSASSPDKNKINLQYKGAFLHHPIKFSRALDKLPDRCKILNTGGFLDSGFLSDGFITEDLIANLS